MCASVGMLKLALAMILWEDVGSQQVRPKVVEERSVIEEGHKLESEPGETGEAAGDKGGSIQAPSNGYKAAHQHKERRRKLRHLRGSSLSHFRTSRQQPAVLLPSYLVVLLWTLLRPVWSRSPGYPITSPSISTLQQAFSAGLLSRPSRYTTLHHFHHCCRTEPACFSVGQAHRLDQDHGIHTLAIDNISYTYLFKLQHLYHHGFSSPAKLHANDGPGAKTDNSVSGGAGA